MSALSKKWIKSLNAQLGIPVKRSILKMGHPLPLFLILSVFSSKQTIFTANKCEQISIYLVVSDTGIRTHDLLDMSILPYPLDQGTRLRLSIFDLFLIFRTVRPNLFENTYRHRDLIPRWLQSLLFSRGAPQLMWDEGSYLSYGKLLC